MEKKRALPPTHKILPVKDVVNPRRSGMVRTEALVEENNFDRIEVKGE